MKTDSTNQRAFTLGKYIAETGATVRQCATIYNVSKSTVHTDVTRRLSRVDRSLYGGSDS